MKHKKRFVIFADFLGTKQRYAKPTLVVKGRELLEQALARCVVPRMKANDMYLYVYSDTAIVTCPRLGPLLEPISDLFDHFFELRADSGDKTSLWLRAAISHGTVLSVDHLQNYERIRTIPFLDTSLPNAFKLESIRKGSRVFVDPAIPDEAFAEYGDLFFKWRQIAGHGEHVPNVREYLWPAKSHVDREHLARTTLKVNKVWNEALGKREWSRDDYYGGMIHLDETLKLFIRTLAVFCPNGRKAEVLFALLPKSDAREKNIRYKWGMWFQALKGLIVHCEFDAAGTQEVASAFRTVRTVLKNGGYFQHFMSELKLPDYAPFMDGLSRLGLDESD